MPLLYGEGEKAFQRLQEEIIKTSIDLSIFAWEDSRSIDPRSVDPRQHFYRGFLACCPQEFEACGKLKFLARAGPSNPCSITNHGVSIRLHLREVDKRDQLYFADLDTQHSFYRPVGIYLKRLSKTGDQFARVCFGVSPVIENALALSVALTHTLISRFATGPVKEQVFVPTKLSPSGLPQDHPIFAVSRFHVDTQFISLPKSSITCECMTPGAFKFDGD